MLQRYRLLTFLLASGLGLCSLLMPLCILAAPAPAAPAQLRPVQDKAARTESFAKPKGVTTVVYFTAPTIECKQGQTLTGAQIFKAIDTDAGSAFTAIVPVILTAFGPTGLAPINEPRVIAGTETAILGYDVKHAGGGPWWGAGYCPRSAPRATVQVKARAGVLFDLKSLANHKVYSATLTLEPSQTVNFGSGRFTLSPGGRCHILVAAADQKWTGDLTYSRPGLVRLENQPTDAVDVTKLVSSWASHADANDYGFIIASDLPSSAPVASNACLTRFATPSLKVVYF